MPARPVQETAGPLENVWGRTSEGVKSLNPDPVRTPKIVPFSPKAHTSVHKFYSGSCFSVEISFDVGINSTELACSTRIPLAHPHQMLLCYFLFSWLTYRLEIKKIPGHSGTDRAKKLGARQARLYA